MKEVTVSIDELMKRVQLNRDRHRVVYLEAMKGYRAAVVQWHLDKPFETHFKHPRPEDHTEDYDVVLDMLMLSTETEIKLTRQEFMQYVRDDWTWKQNFVGTVSNYTQMEV